jgi:hypothetical protein
MTIFRTIKDLLTITAGGAMVAGLATLAVAAVLVLFVIPGGLGILTIEFERLKRWLRRMSRWLIINDRQRPGMKSFSTWISP